MSDQTELFGGLASRFRADATKAVDAARKLRRDAKALRDEVSGGGYDQTDLAKFWSIIGSSARTLQISPRELSERAGLGPVYFQSVTKEHRSPKLHNFLRALSSVIETADERLSEIDGEKETSDVEWRSNPLHFDEPRLETLQRELRDLIRHIKASNSLSDIPELDDEWRKTLISLLETVIQVLKAPLIEPSILRRTSKMLMSFSAKVGGDARAAFVGALAGTAATALTQIVTSATH